MYIKAKSHKSGFPANRGSTQIEVRLYQKKRPEISLNNLVLEVCQPKIRFYSKGRQYYRKQEFFQKKGSRVILRLCGKTRRFFRQRKCSELQHSSLYYYNGVGKADLSHGYPPFQKETLRKTFIFTVF